MEDLFGCVIVILVGCVMLSIGIVQYRKKDPVGFYSGEKPPRPDELTDVTEWNHKHGMLWMGFGLSIFLGCLLGFLLFLHYLSDCETHRFHLCIPHHRHMFHEDIRRREHS